jgi:hypothetical protein
MIEPDDWMAKPRKQALPEGRRHRAIHHVMRVSRVNGEQHQKGEDA